MTNKETASALFIAARFIGKQESDEWMVDVTISKGIVIGRYFYDIGEMTAERRAQGGKWDKRTTEYEFALVKSIGENVKVELSTSRNVACTPRVTGTETIEVKDYSNVPTKTVERDIVEWDCNPVLDA